MNKFLDDSDLPSAEAMDQAIAAVQVWDSFPTALITLRGRVFIAIECNNKHSIHVSQVVRGANTQFAAFLTMQHEGRKKLTLAQMLDMLTRPITSDELAKEVRCHLDGIYLPDRSAKSCVEAAMRVRWVGKMFRLGYGCSFLVAAALYLYGFDVDEAAKIGLDENDFIVNILPEDTAHFIEAILNAEHTRKSREQAEDSWYYGFNWKTMA